MSGRHLLQQRFPLLLVKLAGGDYRLLLRSGKVVTQKFCQASVCLLAALLLTTFSVFYGTDLLFHIWQVELLLALFMSALFGCIYLFLIVTLSKSTRQGRLFSLANCVRIGFIVFMAFLVSKPIEVFFFSATLDNKVAVYKTNLLTRYEKRIDSLRTAERSAMIHAMQTLEKQIVLYPDRNTRQDLAQLQQQLSRIEEERTGFIKIAARRIDRSDFLLYRVQQLSHKPWAWVICVIIVILFLLPGYLIYSIPLTDPYYQLKDEAEKMIVREEYENFRQRFKCLFKNSWGLAVEPYTPYEDPPFNTIRIQQTPALSNDDFIARYLR